MDHDTVRKIKEIYHEFRYLRDQIDNTMTEISRLSVHFDRLHNKLESIVYSDQFQQAEQRKHILFRTFHKISE